MTVQELIDELEQVEDKSISVGFILNYTFFNIEKENDSFGIIEKEYYENPDMDYFSLGEIGDL